MPLYADFINRMPLTLAWQEAPLGKYQVQFTVDLSGWHDFPNGPFLAEVYVEPPQWQEPSPGTRRFYRIMRLR